MSSSIGSIYHSTSEDDATSHYANVNKIAATIAQDEWGGIQKV